LNDFSPFTNHVITGSIDPINVLVWLILGVAEEGIEQQRVTTQI
jgi:hypothetical protein